MSLAATLVNPLIELAVERGADHVILSEGRQPALLTNSPDRMGVETLADHQITSRLEMVEYQAEVRVRHGDEFVAGTDKHARRVRLTVDHGQITQKLFMSLTLLSVEESGVESE